MKIRWLPAVLLFALASPTQAQIYGGFRVGTLDAPAPPAVVARKEPRIILVPNTRVYKIRDAKFELDADVFLFGGQWFVYRQRYWYTSRTLRGRYVPVDVRHVPQAILIIHPKHWKHHPGGPEPFSKRAATARNRPRPPARKG